MRFNWSKVDMREEEIFADLHHFLLRRNNRNLTNEQIVEITGIAPELLHKWVKTGKLKTTIFTNLGAPCERCGNITQGKICLNCSDDITGTLAKEEKDKLWFKKIQQTQRQSTYHYR